MGRNSTVAAAMYKDLNEEKRRGLQNRAAEDDLKIHSSRTKRYKELQRFRGGIESRVSI